MFDLSGKDGSGERMQTRYRARYGGGLWRWQVPILLGVSASLQAGSEG